jgi:hypothetical protein
MPLDSPVSIGAAPRSAAGRPRGDENWRALTVLSVRSRPATPRPLLGAVQPPPCYDTSAEPTSQRPSPSLTPARTGVLC